MVHVVDVQLVPLLQRQADVPADLSQPGHARQHEVGDDQVEGGVRALFQKQVALGARERLGAAVALALQVGADHLVDGRVILDDEYVELGFHGSVCGSSPVGAARYLDSLKQSSLGQGTPRLLYALLLWPV